MPRQGLKRKFVVYLVLLVVFISFAFLAFFSFISPEGQTQTILISDLSVTCVLCILGILISFFIVSRLVRPIKALEKGSQAFARGDFSYRIKVKTGDELEDLANAFNKMAQSLGGSGKALEETKNILEVKAKARTEGLQELADNLEDKVERRTKQLSQRVEELERFHRLTVGRELKMMELKKEIAELKPSKVKRDK